jgi:hypothetical protein
MGRLLALALIFLVAVGSSVPSNASGAPIPGHYIVVLKDSVT